VGAARTLQRARTEAIRCAKRAARSSNLRRRVPLTQALDSVNALTARLLAVQASGSLADRVREVVQANQMRAS